MAYAVTTRSTLRTRITERLISVFWTTTELDIYINEAIRMWNAFTGTTFYGAGDVSNSVTTNTFFTDATTWSASLFYVQRLFLANASLDPVRLCDLDELNPTWQSDAAGTINMYAINGLNHVTNYPKPSGSTDVYLQAVLVATVPSSDGDYIQVAEEDMEAIIDYVTFISKLKEGGSETQEASIALQRFLKQACLKNSALNNHSAYRRLLGLPLQQQRRPDAMASNPR